MRNAVNTRDVIGMVGNAAMGPALPSRFREAGISVGTGTACDAGIPLVQLRNYGEDRCRVSPPLQRRLAAGGKVHA
jgi:hypothetical protein